MNASLQNKTVSAQKRPRPPAGNPLYSAPDYAWGTIALFIVALSAWVGAVWLAELKAVSLWLVIPTLSFIAYAFFTVLHDGVHRSISRKSPWLNESLAFISGAFLSPVASAASFRFVHFAHHRTTNEPGNDPDMWSGVGPWWRLPLQWATVDVFYLYYIIKHRSQISAKEWVKIAIAPVVQLIAVIILVNAGLGKELLLYWLIPARIALTWLAFAFNFLPHHPHDVLQSHNPYAATNVREGAETVMTPLFFYQNYHLIHHLFPSIPFYRYIKIWRENRTEFTEKSAPSVKWNALV